MVSLCSLFGIDSKKWQFILSIALLSAVILTSFLGLNKRSPISWKMFEWRFYVLALEWMFAPSRSNRKISNIAVRHLMVGTRAQALSITGPTIGEIGIVIRVVFSGHTIEPKKRFKIGKKILHWNARIKTTIYKKHEKAATLVWLYSYAMRDRYRSRSSMLQSLKKSM